MKWKCRRGLLELDLVLERFLQHTAASLDGKSLELLDELLDYPDNELWDIVNGRSADYLLWKVQGSSLPPSAVAIPVGACRARRRRP